MKIGIIGLGAVGSSVKEGFKYLGHEVIGHDIKLNTHLKDLIYAEIIYICVGTPSNPDGSCNTSSVLSAIESLNTLNYQGIIAIKSTVKPGTTNSLIKKYPNLTLCFVPEFLRERCAYEDFVNNHNILVVGTENEDVYNKVLESHGDLPKNTIKVKIIEAELVKYFSNTYKAMKITYANSFHKIATHLGADYTIIKNTFLMHGVTEREYLDVNEEFAGFGGMCLPKDTKAMDLLVKELNLDLNIFNFIDAENNKFIKKVPKGMRE
jgi:UDPglucose 6-dehydrogenase